MNKCSLDSDIYCIYKIDQNTNHLLEVCTEDIHSRRISLHCYSAINVHNLTSHNDTVNVSILLDDTMLFFQILGPRICINREADR